MDELWGIIRYEYLMQIRRVGLWISLILTIGLFIWLLATASRSPGAVPAGDAGNPWKLAASFVAEFNLFGPIAAGILVADRFTRDRLLGVDQLLDSSLLSRLPLVVGKGVGSLLAIFTPPVILLIGLWCYLAVQFGQPAVLFTGPVAVVAIVAPSWLFVVCWSLFFPLIMPLRLYQVLFAGFWMWAVAISPSRLPTINWSIFGVQGQYAHYALFINNSAQSQFLRPPATTGLAVVNMCLLIGLSVAALALLPVALRMRQKAAS